MSIDLVKEAKERGIKYFLISYTDFYGVQRAKLVPASAIGDMARNGAGFAGFATWLPMSPADPDLFEFYIFESADLRDVEDVLKPRCRIALNLTGDVQAGMLISNAKGARSIFGSSKSPLASIIFIKPRDTRSSNQNR